MTGGFSGVLCENGKCGVQVRYARCVSQSTLDHKENDRFSGQQGLIPFHSYSTTTPAFSHLLPRNRAGKYGVEGEFPAQWNIDWQVRSTPVIREALLHRHDIGELENGGQRSCTRGHCYKEGTVLCLAKIDGRRRGRDRC